MAKINPLVAIGIPTWGKVSVNWARSYRHLGGPLGSNMIELMPVVGKPIAEARNDLMEAAFAEKADFLFMLGDDVLPVQDTLIRGLQRMWDDPSLTLLTGVYWTKGWPSQPYLWRGQQRGPYQDWKYGEFFEVDYAGCDCLLIRLTDEIKALGPEWFSTSWKWNAEDGPGLLATEDFYFYTKARKAGIKLWCDSYLQCIHEDRNSGQQFALTTEMPQYSGTLLDIGVEAKTEEAPLVKLADIGAGFEAPFFGTAEQVKVFRFDANEASEPDYRCDIRRLPVPDQSFDVVHSRHVLEHFGRAETFKVLKEWTRILRIGGEFRIGVPNLRHALTQILMMDEGYVPVDPYPWWQLYGSQSDEYDFHKNGFTVKRVQMLLEELGIFEDIVVTTVNDDLNIYATARKVRHMEPQALLPDWDVIAKQEGITVDGLTEESVKDPEPVAVYEAAKNGNVPKFWADEAEERRKRILSELGGGA